MRRMRRNDLLVHGVGVGHEELVERDELDAVAGGRRLKRHVVGRVVVFVHYKMKKAWTKKWSYSAWSMKAYIRTKYW